MAALHISFPVSSTIITTLTTVLSWLLSASLQELDCTGFTVVVMVIIYFYHLYVRMPFFFFYHSVSPPPPPPPPTLYVRMDSGTSNHTSKSRPNSKTLSRHHFKEQITSPK